MLVACLISAFVLQAPPRIDYTVSWVGNSYSGKDAWVLHDAEDIFVTPDGTVFTNTYWDEAG